jgi:phage minor structural protein
VIKIYADGVLAYDSRLDSHGLQGLSLTLGTNKGGTATIAMPPNHPGYDAYTLYKTMVAVYRDDKLLFRGRPIQRADDIYKQRVITCEGELCFFQDAVSRPYIYQDEPANIFRALVDTYNAQVEEVKRFAVGTVTVTDSNNYIRLESETAESVQDTMNKLLERCGGYITFTTSAEDGKRVINWYATLGHRSGQVIEFGENLLDFTRNGANTGLITAVLPYGAKDETTGLRVTIESVNDGVDYIVDEEARALRGFIIKPVYWDDVTVPLNLLRKAQQYLSENRHIITGLQLTALDLSYMDKSIDSFQVGDYIRVLSRPHQVDEAFFLTDLVLDLLNPANSSISLGKELATLTDADVAGDRKNRGELHKVVHQIQADYTLGIANTVKETELLLTSLIEQTSEAIKQEVSQTYTTNDQLTEAVSTSLTQFKDQFLFEFESLKASLDENDAEAREHFTEIYNYISFENGAIKLGASDSAITLTIENDMIVFRKNGAQFGWWDGVDFHTGNIVVEVNERAQFGHFAFVPRSNGSLSFLKVEG